MSRYTYNLRCPYCDTVQDARPVCAGPFKWLCQECDQHFEFECKLDVRYRITEIQNEETRLLGVE